MCMIQKKSLRYFCFLWYLKTEKSGVPCRYHELGKCGDAKHTQTLPAKRLSSSIKWQSAIQLATPDKKKRELKTMD